jgi:hypothetical protein
MMPRRRKTLRRGITLIELLLALGLITMVSTMMFMFYEITMRSRDDGTKLMTDNQLARMIAWKIADEVRSANGFVTDIGPGISGDERMITLQTVVLPDKAVYLKRTIRDEPPPAQCDLRQVQYYLAYDEDETYDYADGTSASAPMGLVRREIKTLYQTAVFENLAESVDLDLISPEMKYIRFRYFDGVDWVDKWDIAKDVEGRMGNSLPQAVEITVGYKELAPKEEEEMDFDEEDSDLTPSLPEEYDPRTYTVLVRLPQADPFLGSRMMRAQRHSRRSSSTGD